MIDLLENQNFASCGNNTGNTNAASNQSSTQGNGSHGDSDDMQNNNLIKVQYFSIPFYTSTVCNRIQL